jgi:hypothetical protein
MRCSASQSPLAAGCLIFSMNHAAKKEVFTRNPTW